VQGRPRDGGGDSEFGSMAHRYKPYEPDQPHLLPACPQDWMRPDHLAYCVRDVVDQLDLSALDAGYSDDGRGAAAFPPRMMVSLILYAWSNDIYSSRRIARLCVDDLGGRYLAAGYQPDHRTINDFKLRHGAALKQLFVQSLRLCQEAGMVSLGHVSLDGSKLAANASKHKAMSYGRMVEEEARLQAEVGQMMERAAQADAAEDAQFGKDNPGVLFDEEIARRQSRLEKLREAKAALEAEVRAAAEAKQAEREAKEREREAAGKGKLGGKRPADPDTVCPKDKAQRNFTDPDSRIMKGGDGSWVQGYNGQAAVDKDHQVIVGCDLTNMAADAPHLAPMMEQVVENTGAVPDKASADPGYFSAANVEYLEAQGIEAYIPPDRQRHGSPAEPADPLPVEVLAGMSAADRQRHQVSTAAGRAEYAHRKCTVEPTFGQVKGCPGSPGFRGFLRRGLEKCRQDWSLVCAVHNIKKLIRFRLAQQAPAAA
jgi:transposase